MTRPPLTFARLEASAFPAAPRLPLPTGPRPGLGGRLVSRLGHALEHASDDFLDTARYLIAGISVAAFARSLIPARRSSAPSASP